MRIHRLLLQDVRGVTRREIHFPDSGVVVIGGPNEVGKSTLVDALDLLLTERDSSTKAAIRALQPVGADVGSVVEADLTVGPVRAVYRKQWNRGAATQLTLLGPQPEQLTGRPAHERMAALLAEHLDVELYQAQRVLHSGRGGRTWSAARTLTAALDEAAGRAVSEEAGETVVAAVDEEYLRFHTPTGRPTGRWRELQQQHAAADVAVQHARAALAEVDARAAEHAATISTLELLSADIKTREGQLSSLQDRRTRMLTLAAALEQATTATTDAVARRATADRAARERSGTVERLAQLSSELHGAEAEIGDLAATLEPARAAVAESVDRVDRARAASTAADGEALAARQRTDQLADLTELRELENTLRAVDDAARTVELAHSRLAACPVTSALLQQLEAADRAGALAQVAAESAAAHLEVELLDPDFELEVDGRGVTGVSGLAVTEETTLEIAGVARFTVRPPVGADELGRVLREAHRSLTTLLAEVGLPDLAAARDGAESHRSAVTDLERATARLRELTRGRSRSDVADRVQQVRQRIGTLPSDGPSPGPDLDLAAARDAARTAEEAAVLARGQWRSASITLERATEQQHRIESALSAARARMAALAAQQQISAAAVAGARADCPDDELTARLLQAQAAVDEHRRDRERAAAEYEAVADPGLEVAIGRADDALTERRRARTAEERRLVGLTAELELIGAEGRQERADQAETELTRLGRQLTETTERAEGVALLREVLHRHRDHARARYVEPFRAAVVCWGRLWLGPTFDVAVGEDLVLRTRTLDGITVPVEQLSTGAAEQLAVLVRLATAAVVGGTDGVPLVLDDALGFTDPVRLASMGPAFAGFPESQILVLTCDPDRYRALDGATVLLLRPDGTVEQDDRPTTTPTASSTASSTAIPPTRNPVPRSRTGRRSPPDRVELSLFDTDELADDPRVTRLLRRSGQPSHRRRRDGPAELGWGGR